MTRARGDRPPARSRRNLLSEACLVHSVNSHGCDPRPNDFIAAKRSARSANLRSGRAAAGSRRSAQRGKPRSIRRRRLSSVQASGWRGLPWPVAPRRNGRRRRNRHDATRKNRDLRFQRTGRPFRRTTCEFRRAAAFALRLGRRPHVSGEEKPK